jgi:acyl carrier protein
MEESEIYRILNEIARDIFEDETAVLGPQTVAADVENWDSFNHINLIVAVERAFGLRFKTAEFESLQNVGQFVGLIGTKLKSARRS